MNWDTWLRTWEAHSQTQAFKRRVQIAIEIAREGWDYAPGKLYCALSGGKDGVALAGVLAAAGLRDVRHCHIHTPLNCPGMLECAEATAEKLDLDLDISEPEEDVFHWLATAPRSASILDEALHGEFRKMFASGNMLVAYQYEHDFAGAFAGMRAEESKGRRWNRIMRGPLYKLSKDGSWMCLPIVDWSARDVFAAAVLWDLPIHPHYRLLLERFGTDPEHPSSRVDCMLPEERVTQLPAGMQCRVLYPDLWSRLVSVRPELAAHGG